jgi:ribosomal protein S18 acetylase RimI-like enzyme
VPYPRRVTFTDVSDNDVAARARACRNATHAAVCDVIEPWEHGTVVRATRHPNYYDFNVVRVEDRPEMDVDALVAFADEALAGMSHRRLDFDSSEAAEPLRAGLEAKGWKMTRLIWMRHSSALPPGPDIAVEEVPYDAVHPLRVAWHEEESPDLDPTEYHVEAREVATQCGAQVMAVMEGGSPVAFAQVEGTEDATEITQVYVHPDYRGAGRGTAMTRAAVEAAGEVPDLWIVADDDDRPKNLYARLGFRPAWSAVEFLRPPSAA